jgi:two-component system NarL family sensor kinase
MMPEVLLKFGLDKALQDFCNDINRSGVVHISYQSLNLEGKEIAQTTAINLYRIVQELISNILRHAAAREAIVQISYEEAGMTLTVEDDGKGFNADDPANQGGAGWLNIRSRIGYMKGKLDIRSTAGKGTSVQIEVPV